MSSQQAAVAKNLFEAFAAQLATVFETMAGTRPAITCEETEAPSTSGSLCWKQPLPPLRGAAYVVTQDEHWHTAGQRLLAAVGVEDGSEEDTKSTFLETINQALSGLAAHLGKVLRHEVGSAGGSESTSGTPWAVSTRWSSLRIGAGTNPTVMVVGLDLVVIDAVIAAEAAESPAPQGAADHHHHAVMHDNDARTFDLLLDVELPVSVSFGRAHVPLKEVLKLTTGSIVELNRAVVEPVDIIVNNCVIARGEVVVVEGNFGVRIQQVVSRSERLRTIQ